IGVLYSANLLGAIAGAALSGFIWLPALGARGTLWTAAAINFVLLLVAWRLDARTPPLSSLTAPAPLRAKENAGLSMDAWVAGGCFAVSGALAMIYEVVWTRALGLIIGSNSYAFTVMLSAFLAGLFLGSAGAARLTPRVRVPLMALGLVQTLAA